jgi:hypothetical protein
MSYWYDDVYGSYGASDLHGGAKAKKKSGTGKTGGRASGKSSRSSKSKSASKSASGKRASSKSRTRKLTVEEKDMRRRARHMKSRSAKREKCRADLRTKEQAANKLKSEAARQQARDALSKSRRQCARLSRKQASRRAFVEGRNGFESLNELRSGGHVIRSKDDLKRTKHGKYAIAVKRLATVELLAWNKAHRMASAVIKTDRFGESHQDWRRDSHTGNILLPKKDGTEKERRLYNDIRAVYQSLLSNAQERAKLERKVAEARQAAEAHNAALYERTGGHNAHVWAVAKFVTAEAFGFKPDYRALASKDASSKEREYYDSIQDTYMQLMTQRSGSLGPAELEKYRQDVEAYAQRRKGRSATAASVHRHGKKEKRASQKEKDKAVRAHSGSKANKEPKARAEKHARAAAAAQQEAPKKKAPAKKVSAKETSAKKVSAKETSAKKVSAKETPAKKVSAKETPAKKAPKKKTPDMPVRRSSVRLANLPARRSSARLANKKK